jgi:hypothetical protein
MRSQRGTGFCHLIRYSFLSLKISAHEFQSRSHLPHF